MNRISRALVPFILFGIALVAFAFSVFILAYLFLVGAAVGLVLFLFYWIREKFFAPKPIPKSKTTGRIIDSDEWRKL